MTEGLSHPLFVDLDGTYIKTDLLFESFIIAFKQNPFVLFSCLIWLMKGRSNLKYQLAQSADINASSLPLNTEFVSFLEQEHKQGRKLYLATASDTKYAKSIVENTTLFEGYISSDENTNLKGKKKLEKILETDETFAYAGNDAVDFEIFEHAAQCYLVNPSSAAQKKADIAKITRTFDVDKPGFKVWLHQLRLHQWLKNLLILVPLVVSGQFAFINDVVTITLAFLAFSLLASSTYILNDLLDLESDRLHPRKKARPLAAGRISIKNGIVAGAVLFCMSIAISVYIGLAFSFVMIAYLVLTLSYSFKIKQYVGMDVVVLALLYTSRILAGAMAIKVVVSFWLFAFSIFVFLSLALVKRCSELQTMVFEGKSRAKGRDYAVEDYAVLKSFGTASAMLAVLMFCFYINNNVLTNQYQQPDILWMIVPALCYWLMRMWIKTHRGEMHDDPIVFSLKDRGSMITIGFCGVIAIAAQVI